MAPNLYPTLQSSLGLSVFGAVTLCRTGTLSTAPAVMASFCLFITVWLVFRCFIYPRYLSPLKAIPTVFGLPVIGNFLTIFFNEIGTPQREWHRKHGPIIRYIYGLGSERLSIIDDEAIKQITVKDSYNFVKPKPVQNWMSSVLGRGVLLVDGDEHVRQRKALSPAFSTSAIRELTPVFWGKGVLLTNMLLDCVKATPTPIEVGDWLNRATLDVIGAAAFGYEIKSLQAPHSPLRTAYSSVFAFDLTSQIIQTMNNLCSWSRYIPSKINRDMDSAIRTIKDTAAMIVRAKEEGHARNVGAKDIMALVTRQNNSYKDEQERDAALSFETMRDQIMTFLGAGHDTTATAVMWTLDLLAKHPHIQERLRDEIHAAFPYLQGGTDSGDEMEDTACCDLRAILDTAADVDQLPYLSNVCRESLRYIPPIPLTIRENIAPTTLCGCAIPAGTWMYVIANVVNRSPIYWVGDGARVSSPDRFDPDRWDHLPADFTANAFMTFLHGPRSCIGRKFAESEMKIFLCCLLARFRFETDPDWPDQELHKMWRLVLKPRDGMHLRLTRV